MAGDDEIELIMVISDTKLCPDLKDQSSPPATQSQSGQFIVESHEDSKRPTDLQK